MWPFSLWTSNYQQCCAVEVRAHLEQGQVTSGCSQCNENTVTPKTELAVPHTFPLQIPLFSLLNNAPEQYALFCIKMGHAAPGSTGCTTFYSSDSIMPDKSLFHLARPSVASRYSDKNRCQDVLSFLIVKKDCKTIFFYRRMWTRSIYPR